MMFCVFPRVTFLSINVSPDKQALRGFFAAGPATVPFPFFQALSERPLMSRFFFFSMAIYLY